jgi:hypothetical protein
MRIMLNIGSTLCLPTGVLSKHSLAGALCLMMAACSDTHEGAPAATEPAASTASPTNAAPHLRNEITRLEQQGVLPALDRGTDIRGPDSNNDGVRDDIDAYIAALSITDTQRKAAMQRARNQQAKLLVDPTDRQAVISLSKQSIAATKCMADVFEGALADGSDELAFKIEAITANTPERAKRHINYMAALSGTSVSYPSGDTCEE